MSAAIDDLVLPEELAARYGKTRRFVLDKVRAGAWPALKVGRSVRFTTEHVAQIDAMHSVAPSTTPVEQHAAAWGRKTRRSA